ncbi:MAG: RimK/LysX family protein, partial [Nanoarchaeota archaeon]|nr:RimK/LysX family protein [Nanoarchaeota archaeon]
KKESIIARMDTGATNSSIDLQLASKLMLGPVIESKVVRSTHGTRLRPVIETDIEISGHKIKEKFTLADRSHMKYPILVGQNILKKGFLIDPSKEVKQEDKSK